MTEVLVEADEPEVSMTIPRPRVYVPPAYRRVKKLRVLMINKDVRKKLARKNGNEILIWSWNNPPDLPMNCPYFSFPDFPFIPL